MSELQKQSYKSLFREEDIYMLLLIVDRSNSLKGVMIQKFWKIQLKHYLSGETQNLAIINEKVCIYLNTTGKYSNFTACQSMK